MRPELARTGILLSSVFPNPLEIVEHAQISHWTKPRRLKPWSRAEPLQVPFRKSNSSTKPTSSLPSQKPHIPIYLSLTAPRIMQLSTHLRNSNGNPLHPSPLSNPMILAQRTRSKKQERTTLAWIPTYEISSVTRPHRWYLRSNQYFVLWGISSWMLHII